MGELIISGDVIVGEAALLLSDGENTEYDRAIVELTAALFGISSNDHREDVEHELRRLK